MNLWNPRAHGTHSSLFLGTHGLGSQTNSSASSDSSDASDANGQALQGTEFQPALELLRLFAFGSYPDYKARGRRFSRVGWAHPMGLAVNEIQGTRVLVVKGRQDSTPFFARYTINVH